MARKHSKKIDLETIKKRVELQRESIHRSKYMFPYDNFWERIESAADLLDFVIEKTRKMKIGKRKLQLEAKKYFVIASVSAMEKYFRDIAMLFVDAGWTSENFRKKLKEYTFTLADLPEIMHKKVSIGEIVSVSSTFQNLNEINEFFSTMLGVDFIKEVKGVEVVSEESSYTLSSKYPNFWSKVEDLIELRHSIVHYGLIPEKFKQLRREMLLELWENLIAFVAAVDTYLMEKIPID